MNKNFFKEPVFIFHVFGFVCLLLAFVASACDGNWGGFWGNFAGMSWCISSCIWCYFATNK